MKISGWSKEDTGNFWERSVSDEYGSVDHQMTLLEVEWKDKMEKLWERFDL